MPRSGAVRVIPRHPENAVLADGNRPASDEKCLFRTATARSAAVLTAQKDGSVFVKTEARRQQKRESKIAFALLR